VNLWPFIEVEEAEQHSVKRACELLEVSRAAYYEQRKHLPSRRALDDAELTERIKAIHAESKGECWDNAVSESWFATIKTELIDTQPWPTRAGLHRAVFDYIEGWYNTRRLHSSLGYQSPATYEATIQQETAATAA